MRRLTHLDGKRLGKMDLGNEESAAAAAGRVVSAELTISAIKKSQVGREFGALTATVTGT